MSLTRLVKIGFKDVVARYIPKPKVKISGECIACPLTNNYSLVGTAFDYLMRAELKRRCPNTVEVSDIGRTSLSIARRCLKEYKDQCYLGITKKDLAEIKKVVVKYHKLKKKFLRDGVTTDEFIETIIRYARLDVIYREGKYDDVTKDVDPLDIADMRALYNLIPNNIIKENSFVLTDVIFPNTSWRVGGADVDLIIDNAMIDIKTIKDARLNDETWAQLVGYYILADTEHEIGLELKKKYGAIASSIIINGRGKIYPFPEIKEVGIYFSRYGKLWKIDASYIRENKNYEFVKKTLFKMAEERYSKKTS